MLCDPHLHVTSECLSSLHVRIPARSSQEIPHRILVDGGMSSDELDHAESRLLAPSQLACACTTKTIIKITCQYSYLVDVNGTSPFPY